MAVIGYVRVSTKEQTLEGQKHALVSKFAIAKWFEDGAVSGNVKAIDRPGFAALLEYIRESDVLVVAAVDRLGRNTIDVLETVERLTTRGVQIISDREGFDLSTPMGKAMLTMLAAVAELERANLKARQLAGINQAKAEGRALGRPSRIDAEAVAAWRNEKGASIAATAKHFGIGLSSVKRACAMASSKHSTAPVDNPVQGDAGRRATS